MRIVHISDLHFGHHDQKLAASLASDIAAQNPGLIVASGDFTQSGTAREFAEARDFLKTLTAPVFAIPGNHDVPASNLIRRFVSPYGHYRKYIAPELEPYLEHDGVAIAGLKTSRRARFELNWSHGSISRKQLRSLAGRFARTPAEAFRIVVAHHPLLRPETPAEVEMRPITRADLVLKSLAALGVRLVLSGHFHLAYVRKHDPSIIREGTPPGPRQAAAAHILVVQASSTISTRLRGEPNSYNIIDIADGSATIAVREWRGAAWMNKETEHTP